MKENTMTDKLISAVVEAQKTISNANRTAMNEFFKSARNKGGSPYATLEDVIQAVKEPLLEQGVLYQQISEQVQGGVCIETVFYGHGAELRTGKIFVPADKQTPHGYGSALTYARRYSLSLACGIGAEDDDGNTAETSVKKAPKQGRFKIIGDDGETVISHSDDPNEFFQQCRDAMGNPDNVVHQKTCAASKWSIKAAAQARSKKEVKEGFEKMIALYEGDEPESQDDE